MDAGYTLVSKGINVTYKLNEIQSSVWVFVIAVCLSVLGLESLYLEIYYFFSDPLRNINCYIYACNETDLMHYLLPVYSLAIHLHVSGLLVAHHQEVAMYICNSRYILYVVLM
jgi:hypothetical protein